MFTGLVAGRGVVSDVRPDVAGSRSPAPLNSDTPIRLTVRVPAEFGSDGKLGESVCINGCCLTAVAFEDAGKLWAFQAGSETLSKTNLSALRAGDVVNLE